MRQVVHEAKHVLHATGRSDARDQQCDAPTGDSDARVGLSDARARRSDARDRSLWVARDESLPGGHKGRPPRELRATGFTRLAASYVSPAVLVLEHASCVLCAEVAPSPGDTIAPPVPTFPEWWTWDLSFTGHVEMRMEQRGVTEVELRAMLERATGFRPNVVEGRFMIDVRHQASPWNVIVEPDAEARLLVVVTVYEVSE